MLWGTQIRAGNFQRWNREFYSRIRDRAGNHLSYGLEVPAAIRAMGIVPLHTALRSPRQNGVAERWVGSCRRELLDHVIPVSERHLRRLLSDYVDYYHDDRTHLGLSKVSAGGKAHLAVSGTLSEAPLANISCPISLFLFPQSGAFVSRSHGISAQS